LLLSLEDLGAKIRAVRTDARRRATFAARSFNEVADLSFGSFAEGASSRRWLTGVLGFLGHGGLELVVGWLFGFIVDGGQA
jgi:hypothetical protein